MIRKRNLIFSGILLFLFALQLPARGVSYGSYNHDDEDEKARGVRISYYGHACFALQGLSSRKTILIDPFSKLDYPPIRVRPDVVLVTHEHFDHNNVAAAKGEPLVIRGLKEDGKDWNEVDRDLDWVRIAGIPSYHDEEEGKQRGKNTIFMIEMEEMRIVHAGDLGHPLTDKQVAKLWPTDVLLVPVGGHFTIDPKKVMGIAGRIDPKLLIPMHYKTEYTGDLPIAPLSDFLKGKKNVKKLKGHEYTIFSSTLPKKLKIVVFKVKEKRKK